MKKNFFKLVLLGAFTLSLGAGFVGCKDYDDDIANLQGQIDALKGYDGTVVKSVTYDQATGILTVTPTEGTAQTYTISGGLPATTVVTSLNEETGVVTVTVNGVSDTFTLPEGSGGPGFDPTQLTVAEDGTLMYGDTATDVEIPTGNGGAVVTLQTEDGVVTGYTIIDGENQLAVTLGTENLPLKSIVFEPQAYLNGIEAMKAVSYDYPQWTLRDGTYPEETAGFRLQGEIWEAPGVNRPDTTTVTLPVVAYYHLNPSTVTEDQIEKVEVNSNDMEFIGTRAALSNPTVKDYSVENGMLRVVFDMAAEDIYGIKDDSVTHLQVRVTPKNVGVAVVSSDYAAVYRVIEQQFTLSLNDKPETPHNGALNERHVYGADSVTYGVYDALGALDTAYPTSLAEYTVGLFASAVNGYYLAGHAKVAIDSEYDYTVNYDGGELDLKEKISIHYKTRVDGPIADYPFSDEIKMDMDKLADYGMELRFALSDYYVGQNLTNQSDFATIADGVLKPGLFSVDPVTGIPASLDREPLVRVELVDTKNDQVINAGWIKVRIVRGESGIVDKTKEFDPFLVQCATQNMRTEVEWMNVEIYNALGLTYNEFHDIYDLVIRGGGGTAAEQYDEYRQVRISTIGAVNAIVETENDRPTELLRWTVGNAAQEIALDQEGDEKGMLETKVAYAAAGRDTVFITLKTQVIEPTVTLSDKISNFWNTAQDSMYVNVEVPLTLTNYADFVTDLDNAFRAKSGERMNRPAFTISNDAATVLPAEYNWDNDDIAYGATPTYNPADNNVGYYYRFDADYYYDSVEGEATPEAVQEDAEGNEYTLVVDNSQIDPMITVANASFSYLLATADDGATYQLVATIDTWTGLIEYNNAENTQTGYGAASHYNWTTVDWPGPYTAATSAVTPITVVYAFDTPYTVTTTDNTIAKALLNRDHATGSNMFAAAVETVFFTKTDDKAEVCHEFVVTNGDFFATFYRPLNAIDSETEDFIDSDNAGHRINYVDLIKLTDWRLYMPNNDYWDDGAKHFYTEALEGTFNSVETTSYWQYYDVQSITLDVDNIRTTLNGADWALLSTETNQLVLNDVQPTTVPYAYDTNDTTGYDKDDTYYDNVDFGAVLYTNAGLIVTESFQLSLPIKVTYKWGEFTTNIIVDVLP